MACYDCEDCGKHKNNGGKCTRFEYDCSFSHLKSGWSTTQEQVDNDVKTAIELKTEIKQLITDYKNKFHGNGEYNGDCWYSQFFQPIVDAYVKLEGLTDEKLVQEWNEIKSR